jgi:hypothetical protein
MPKVQRDEYVSRALDQIRQAQGWLGEILERHGPKSAKPLGEADDA